MHKQIVFPGALMAMREARAWYKAISPVLSTALSAEIDATLKKVVRAPFSYGVRFQIVHRINLSQFPYASFFVVNEETKTVDFIRFFHIKMDVPYNDEDAADNFLNEP